MLRQKQNIVLANNKYYFIFYTLFILQDITGILSSIEERLRILDTISAVQGKQARRLDVIQDKLGEYIEKLFCFFGKKQCLVLKRCQCF